VRYAAKGTARLHVQLAPVFSYLLRLPDGEPFDPPGLVSAIPNWSVNEVITFGGGDQARVVAIDWEPHEELVDTRASGRSSPSSPSRVAPLARP
jgi:hypothetical protein